MRSKAERRQRRRRRAAVGAAARIWYNKTPQVLEETWRITDDLQQASLRGRGKRKGRERVGVPRKRDKHDGVAGWGKWVGKRHLAAVTLMAVTD
ncbi:hypothetical protein E2C01_063719 [Portunus trituberculatus]|uniref:Uncharacterized protein n=1 Tax=Portunus trituberculatus TaxID=210409 RepID=A0A5B7HH46_PORTR|nr:hypothetical protein [Portunus trituberculatus]